jgi:NADH-quinone oxidoreductase subunit L
MGALHKKMPITSLTFLVATLAIAGFPFLSGFYSKDAILASALLFVSKHNSHYLLFIFPAVAACITAFYMMRLYLLTFFTSPKDQHVHHHAHESPVVMWLPLVILAILSLGVGWGSVIPEGKSLGKGQYEFHGGRGLAGLIASAQPDWTMSWQMNDLAEMKKIPASHPEESSHTDEHSTSHESHQLHKLVTILATSAMILGFGFAFVVYRFRWISAEKSASLLRPIYLLLWNKFYVDELYRATVVAGVLKLAAIGKWIDLNILDGIADGSARWVVRWAFFSGLVLDNRGVDGAVNGTAAVVMAGGNIARKGQTGRVRNYLLMTLTLIALTIAVSVFWMIL